MSARSPKQPKKKGKARRMAARKADPAKQEPVSADLQLARLHPSGGGTLNIEIIPFVPPDLVTHYADNLNVIHTETEIIVSFLQLQPPILLQEKPDASMKVQSKCVARVVFSPAKMPTFIDALIKNWHRYTDKYLQMENPDVATQTEDTEGD